MHYVSIQGIHFDLVFQAVAAHEKAMREQAKKMNVASLRSSDAANTSAECKLAKVLKFFYLHERRNQIIMCYTKKYEYYVKGCTDDDFPVVHGVDTILGH